MGKGCFHFSLEVSLSRRCGEQLEKGRAEQSFCNVLTCSLRSVLQVKKRGNWTHLKVTQMDPIFHPVLFDSPWNSAFPAPDVPGDTLAPQSSPDLLTHQLAGPLFSAEGGLMPSFHRPRGAPRLFLRPPPPPRWVPPWQQGLLCGWGLVEHSLWVPFALCSLTQPLPPPVPDSLMDYQTEAGVNGGGLQFLPSCHRWDPDPASEVTCPAEAQPPAPSTGLSLGASPQHHI